ncbi:T9SS type A sorting domain-containing protein [candidate division WOR-3 bacterium]|nr:T9SS type A sorting domain-containing protein [candidate division WOR-3 bacterium]
MRKITALLFASWSLALSQVSVTSAIPGEVKIKIRAPESVDALTSHSKLDLENLYPGTKLVADTSGTVLPQYVIYIGVPPHGEVRVDFQLGSSRNLKGIQLDDLHWPAVLEKPGDEPRISHWVSNASRVDYTVSRWRDYRVVVINARPIFYDTTTNTLTLYKEIAVEVSFSEPPYQTGEPITNSNLEYIYSSSITNYEQCKDWTIPFGEVASNPFKGTDNWIKVRIPEDGVYRISFRDLKKLDIEPDKIDPKTLRLVYAGERLIDENLPDTLKELPIYVHGEMDGSFDREDYIVFFARGANHWDFTQRRFETNPYVNENVYWLTWGGAKGIRNPTRAAYPLVREAEHSAPGILHFEEDHECPGRAGFLWLWEEITKTNVDVIRKDTFILDLSGVIAVDTFTIKAYTTTRQAGFRVLVDEDTLYSIPVADDSRYPPDYVSVSPGFTIKDELPLVIEVFGPSEQNLYPDWIRMVATRELSFKHNPFWVELEPNKVYEFGGVRSGSYLYDYSDPANPVILTDWQLKNRKLVMSTRTKEIIPVWVAAGQGLLIPDLEIAEPGKLWDEDWNVDYVILSTSENFEAASELSEYRSQNLQIPGVSTPRVKAVDLADIVRDFGYGLAEPQAIRHFLSYVYNKSAGRTLYVLIMGDGSYDYKNNLGFTGRPEYFPIHTQDTILDPNVYTVIAATKEAWFVDFDDDGEHNPEMCIARITARGPREAYDVLEKIKAYEQVPAEAWQSRVILLSDDYYEGSPSIRDPISNHIPANEELAKDYLYPEFDPVKVYLSDYPLIGGRKDDAKKALIDALNRGALLWQFFGHGNGSQLAHEEVFLYSDASGLQNGSKLPLALFCSCGVGRFEDTRWECVAEELLRNENGGVIASIAATKGTGPDANQYMTDSLFSKYRGFKNSNLGDLFFSLVPGNSITILYVLFGDPGMRFSFPTALEVSSASDSFVTGDTAVVLFNAPAEEGGWFASAYGSWVKKKEVVYGIGYGFKGDLLYRARGELSGEEQILRFIVPQGVAEGDSAYIHLMCADDDSIYTYRIEPIKVVTGSVTSSDYQGPTAGFLVNGKPVLDGDTVLPSFTLTIELQDQSGINLAGKTGLRGPAIGRKFSLEINESDPVDLSPYFEYEVSSDELATKGVANLPISFAQEDNILTLYAVDNMRNTSQYDLNLYTAFERNLEVETPLVYPNPVSSTAEFTFELNAAADVSVLIFSISGRLVRRLPVLSYPEGFSSYAWDGLDASGRPLPNGVYIYRLTAETGPEDAWLPNARTSVNEKFIVVH